MLVLTRKTQQQIHIGNNVVITILQVKGQNVRVGIEAPRDVRVVRAELKPKSIETGDGQSATTVTSTRQDTLPLPASTAHDDQPAAYDRNLREQSISTATVAAPVAVTRSAGDWSDRLAMRSFSRPDRRATPTTLAGLVAARRNA